MSRLTATAPPGGRRRTPHPGWPRGAPPVGASRRDPPPAAPGEALIGRPGTGVRFPPPPPSIPCVNRETQRLFVREVLDAAASNADRPEEGGAVPHSGSAPADALHSSTWSLTAPPDVLHRRPGLLSWPRDHARERGARVRRLRGAADLEQVVDAFGRDLDERPPASLTSTASSDSLWIREVRASMPPSSDRSAMRTRAETPCCSRRRWASASSRSARRATRTTLCPDEARRSA